MTSTTLFRGLLAAIFASLGFSAAISAAAGPPLPSLPGPNGGPPAATAPPPANAPPAGDPGALMDRAKRGIVAVERDGRPLAAGTVLANDGRVLTSLSALGASESADIRYVDGHTVKSRVGHRDAAWDLALLVPLAGRWTDGLMASEADPSAIELKILPPRAGKTLPTIALKGRTDVRSKDGDTLPSALDLDLKGTTPPTGSPIVDASGSVVGMLIRACKMGDAKTCAPIVVGAPVGALRNFLVRTPLNAVAPAPWLGIVGAPDTSGNARGVRVMAVAPQSPAEKGGLKSNPDRGHADMIVAVDGQPVETPEALADMIGKHAIGESVKLLVLGGGEKFKELSVVLRAAP